jgi:hypothetical protein
VKLFTEDPKHIRLSRLRSPITLGETLAHPAIGVDVKKLAAEAGVATTAFEWLPPHNIKGASNTRTAVHFLAATISGRLRSPIGKRRMARSPFSQVTLERLESSEGIWIRTSL